MKTKMLGIIWICAVVFCYVAGWDIAKCEESAPGKEVYAPIMKAAVFGNGYAFITRTFETGPEGGTFYITDIPQLVHGTLWIESVNGVDVRVVEKNKTSPITITSTTTISDFSFNAWKGKNATVLMENNDQISGSIVTLISSNDGKYLIIETVNGVEFLNFDNVQRVQIHTNKDLFTHGEAQESIPTVLEFTVAPSNMKLIVTFSYLIKGLYWAPAYRLELSGLNDGLLTMEIIFKNELMPIEQAVIELVSGTPNIHCKDVITPMTPGTKWDQFLSELNREANHTEENVNGGNNTIVVQAIPNVSPVDFETAFKLPQSIENVMESEASGFDMQYQNIGKQTFNYGEPRFMRLGESNVKIRRVVEWNISDNMDPNGKYYWDYPYAYPDISAHTQKPPDEVWDTIHFLNPFNFAMTTAPITVFQDGKFVGQSQSLWTASGQEVIVRINKAGNLKINHSEIELVETQEHLNVGGLSFWKAKHRGYIYVRNNRPETQHIVIKRRFSGKMLKSEGDPETTLLFEGMSSFNPRNQLKWIVDLKHGEEIGYEYEFEFMRRN